MELVNRNNSKHIYKIDKFILPDDARDEFIEAVRLTHKKLRTQEGFIGDSILTQVSGEGKYNFITIVEWENAESMKLAKSSIEQYHQQIDFNPHNLFQKYNITIDRANYTEIDIFN